jgi:OFA family oxalate/formate antiporter-like MFS transporter
MPSTAGRFFGVRNVGAIYGLMLIGWSIGGVVGPLLIASLIGSEKAYTLGFTVIGVITLIALVLPLVTKRPRYHAALDAADSRGRRGVRGTDGTQGSASSARR